MSFNSKHNTSLHIPLHCLPHYLSSYLTFILPPMSSDFTLHRDSNRDPYLDMYEDIPQFLTMGDAILLGDFNAYTGVHKLHFTIGLRMLFASRFMCNCVSSLTLLLGDIQIVVFYFCPTSLDFALHGDSDRNLYLHLHEDIVQFLIVGDVILLADFNACIGNR
jgi:hypothetical protein